MTSNAQQAEAWLRSEDPREIERALAFYSEAASRTPDDPAAWFQLAGAYDYLGKEETAIVHYERVVSLGIDRLSKEDQPKLYLQMGSTLRNLRRFSKSIEILETGLSRYPDFHALRAFLALTHYSMKDFQRAASLWFDCVLLGSSDPSIQRYFRALRGYREVLDTFP